MKSSCLLTLLCLLSTQSLFVSSFVPSPPVRRSVVSELAAKKASTTKETEDDSGDDSIPSFVRNPSDGGIVHDPNGLPLTVDRMLGTQPLRRDLHTRPGPGRRELTYMSGETVISTLNQIFGYDGWSLRVLEKERILKEQDGNAWRVAYCAHVRITLTECGTYKEDYGTGDAMDRQLGSALQMALKASVTDAVKRAARHFGDKLGSCLYQSDFDLNKAPKTLREALDQFDQQH